MMITPTRFGLKFGPIPTLALEYEDDLVTLDDGRATTSLYVYSGESKSPEPRRTKRLHVVELPALTKDSEPVTIARQLQQNNRRFLAPDIVKEDQLVRLLQRLMAHLQATELSVSAALPAVDKTDDGGGSMAGKFGSQATAEEEKESELEESTLDESMAEVSASMASSQAEDSDKGDGDESLKAKPESGANTSESAAIETAADESTKQADAVFQIQQSSQETRDDKDDGTSPAKSSRGESEAEEDAAKHRALMSESESSDENEDEDEDIQSEELEYFSEDASDEDSF